MISAPHPNPLFDFVVYRLRTAGWSNGQRFVIDSGYYLEWTERGYRRGLRLQQIICRYELYTGAAAYRFTRYSYGAEEMEAADIPSENELAFWRMCLEELEIGQEQGTLAALAQVIALWHHGNS